MMEQPNALLLMGMAQRLGLKVKRRQRLSARAKRPVSNLGAGVELAKRWEMEALEAA
jgi:hypothetical protein